MFKVCGECDYFSQDTSLTECPDCSARLQLTSLPPKGVEIVTENDAVLCSPVCEAMELPPVVRLAQVVTGVAIFFMVTRWGNRILFFLIGSDPDVNTAAEAAYLMGYTCFLYVAASLAGGAVAGAWSVNWVPQGIGVGLGVLAIPMILLLILLPSSVPIYLIGVMVTTLLKVLGAYVGHRIVRPSQFIS